MSLTTDMVGRTNEDLLGGLGLPAGAGSAISLMRQARTQAVHLTKEEKVPDVTDDMGYELKEQFETDGEFHFVIQKS